MIRQPSTTSQLYGWHRAALAGENPPIHDGLPECGWYKRKMVKGGPWVPARIFITRDIDPETGELTDDERMLIEIDGETYRTPEKQWTYLIPISRADYEALKARKGTTPAMAATMVKINLSDKPMRP